LKSVKSQKSDEITQNRDFRTDFAIVLKWCAETKFPPWSSCQAPIGCGNAQSRESLFTVFSLQLTNP
jgi:hypothetical protein